MRKLQAILLFFVFAGCETPGPNGGGVGKEPGWTEIYTNKASGFQFPTQIGNFIRQSVKEYDAKGENVGVGYNDLANSVAMTVYVYPQKLAGRDSTIEGHLAALNSQILQVHKNARLVAEEAVEISMGGTKRKGRRATFSYTELFANQVQEVRAQLYLFREDEKFIKYRVSYPAANRSNAEPSISAFFEGLVWPSR